MTKEEYREQFAVFIMSHGRANDVKTVKMLGEGKYSGDWYIVIDNEDDQENIYRELYGERIIQFDKKKESEMTDTGDLEDDRRCGVFARNAIQKIAREMGYKAHLQLDDDFFLIDFRYIDTKKNKMKAKKCFCLDKIFFAMFEYLMETTITDLSLSLSSYYLGGVNKNVISGLIPKTMGSFMLKSSDPIEFKMRMNDDIASTAHAWTVGKMCFSVMAVQVQTPPTQQEKGGMTEIYQDNGTYRKSFYNVMLNPSFEKIAQQGRVNFRIHHATDWGRCCPCIVSEKWKKNTIS